MKRSLKINGAHKKCGKGKKNKKKVECIGLKVIEYDLLLHGQEIKDHE